MQSPVLQERLPHLPWMDARTARLPGILPLDPQDWLRRDEAFSGQMALRDQLIAERVQHVHALLPEAHAAADELYHLVLARLEQDRGYRREGDRILRPDGIWVKLDVRQPLLTLGQLIQADLCLLERDPDEPEHRLTGAILCFPASWTLSQKIGRPLMAIHEPVPPYGPDLGRRVQRLFDAIRPEQPLWRMNWLTYDDWTLHQPRLEGEKRPAPQADMFVRSERQCLLRLPQTRAVVFSIHTYVVRAETLTDEERLKLMESLSH